MTGKRWVTLLYEKGEGVRANLRKAFSLYKRKAFSLYKRGAELGDKWAQCNLKVAYLDGLGTKPDLAEGIKWLRRSARKGDAKAQYNLGMAYLDGEGVRQSRRHASTWLERAANQGHKKASRTLKSLRK